LARLFFISASIILKLARLSRKSASFIFHSSKNNLKLAGLSLKLSRLRHSACSSIRETQLYRLNSISESTLNQFGRPGGDNPARMERNPAKTDVNPVEIIVIRANLSVNPVKIDFNPAI
jgi:hypothetical protein